LFDGDGWRVSSRPRRIDEENLVAHMHSEDFESEATGTLWFMNMRGS
jgi:hypothetical protein